MNPHFIKADIPFVKEYRETNPAPLFRKTFSVKKAKEATLQFCALGFGYCWINGKRISGDLFTAPVSNYEKTLWYNTYDVTELLKEGENTIAVICGNGWYNESLETPWVYNEAPWRDNPKFALHLSIDGETVLTTDDTWRCCEKSAIFFNELRSGEHFDTRLYDENWNKPGFDDSCWGYAIVDNMPPRGVFREYPCQPVKECAEYPTISFIKTGEDRYVFDIGQNISGYIRLKIKQAAGDVLTLRYAEQLNDDNSLNFNDMDSLYKNSPFQTDRFICNGEEFTWSPMFVYHGFRYIEITGIKEPSFDTVTGIFVHLDTKMLSGFECSDPFLNTLFRIGQMANLSNLQHVPTDCPTREKLGWANDAQASAAQMLMNFDTVLFFKKWLQDIKDAVREDGAIPGIIPTSGCAYDWGTGPVSSGILFELPYQLYRYTGDKEPLIGCIPYFKRHLDHLSGKADEDGLIGYGLSDWAGPFDEFDKPPVPNKFTDSILYIKFLKIAVLAAELAGDETEKKRLSDEQERFTAIFKKEYILPDGSCAVEEQTSVSMLIYHGIYENLTPLAEQLKRQVEKHAFHHHCGMVGLRHLYYALNICGLQEYAYRIITASGFPSYRKWVEEGATTLWESWQPGNSKNHHMYSDFMLWMMNTLVGIRLTDDNPGMETMIVDPYFVPQLDHCSGYRETPNGKLEVCWKRTSSGISLDISVPKEMEVRFRNETLLSGKYHYDL